MLVSKQKLFAAMSVPTQKVLVQRLSAATVRVRRPRGERQRLLDVHDVKSGGVGESDVLRQRSGHLHVTHVTVRHVCYADSDSPAVLPLHSGLRCAVGTSAAVAVFVEGVVRGDV